MPKKKVILWILALAFLAVGAKNFEYGLTIDAPLYASIARNMADSHDYFRMESGTPDFRPFCEHPHLSFWLNALVFKVFTPDDWSIRIIGHLCYILILFLFFLYTRWQFNQKTAVLTVFILWTFSRFSNLFSAAGQEPPFLLFAALSVFLSHYALEKKKLALFVLGGICFSLSMMSKGLAIIPYFPAIGFLFAYYFFYKKNYKFSLLGFSLFALASVVTLASYYFVVKNSTNPEFFDIYWSRQYTNRFGREWTLRGLLDPFYWGKLFKESNFLFPLAFVAAYTYRKNVAILLAFIIFAANTVSTASVALWGGQYWVPMMPWLAFLIAAILSKYVSSEERIVKFSFIFAIVAILLLQYIPYRVHPVDRHPHERVALYLSQKFNIKNAYMEQLSSGEKYILGARLAWYGHMKDIQYWLKGEAPKADKNSLVFVVNSTPEISSQLKKAHWCLFDNSTTIWVSCDIL
jgi:4-amino-4-deoxy-L-arabinose transferase-like glycosyltransferase